MSFVFFGLRRAETSRRLFPKSGVKANAWNMNRFGKPSVCSGQLRFRFVRRKAARHGTCAPNGKRGLGNHNDFAEISLRNFWRGCHRARPEAGAPCRYGCATKGPVRPFSWLGATAQSRRPNVSIAARRPGMVLTPSSRAGWWCFRGATGSARRCSGTAHGFNGEKIVYGIKRGGLFKKACINMGAPGCRANIKRQLPQLSAGRAINRQSDQDAQPRSSFRNGSALPTDA